MPHTKKVLILDLDNTIFPTASIGDEVYAPLMELIKSSGYKGDTEGILKMLNRKPFQHVAEEFELGEELTQKGTELLSHTTYDKPIDPFPDYAFLKALPHTKYLVTMGFEALQQSKVIGLDISNDFAQVYVVDPATTEDTKKEIFQNILATYGHQPADVLVVGDDADSEIDAAQKLGIDTVLYDKDNMYTDTELTKITSFEQLVSFV